MSDPQPDIMNTTAKAVAGARTLEDLTRPFLDLLHRLTGLDSTYLTEIHLDRDEQKILFSDNRGRLEIAEGLVVPWDDTVCRRALLSGRACVDDVQEAFPDSQAGIELGIRTYVSVPVVDPEDQVIGTLCAASDQRVDVPDDALQIMKLFARLIADQWERDRAHNALVAKNEESEKRIRRRAMFLAEAEHKLKTPLTILRGWSDMLADGWQNFDDATRQKAIEAMQQASLKATTQVDELLEEARSEVLSTQLDIERVDLEEVLQRIAREGQAASTIHRIVARPSIDVAVLADENALWQALWHLTENAMKYSPEGGTIGLSAHTQGSVVVVNVDDEGLGIPADIDLFAPFTRSDERDFTDIGGTGLGLHIVRNLVNAMSGTVSAARREAKGSRFTIRLPAAAGKRQDTSNDLLGR